MGDGLRAKGLHRGRPWSMTAITAALDLLTRGDTDRLSSVERRRLGARLDGKSAEDLVGATRSRVNVQRCQDAAIFIDRVRKEVALTGAAAIDNDTAAADEFGVSRSPQASIDGYVTARLPTV